MEPRFNEVAGDRPNLFIKWRVRYIEVLFHTFYCNFGRDIGIIPFVISRTSLNRGSLNRGSTVSLCLSPTKSKIVGNWHSTCNLAVLRGEGRGNHVFNSYAH